MHAREISAEAPTRDTRVNACHDCQVGIGRRPQYEQEDIHQLDVQCDHLCSAFWRAWGGAATCPTQRNQSRHTPHVQAHTCMRELMTQRQPRVVRTECGFESVLQVSACIVEHSVVLVIDEVVVGTHGCAQHSQCSELDTHQS